MTAMTAAENHQSHRHGNNNIHNTYYTIDVIFIVHLITRRRATHGIANNKTKQNLFNFVFG